MTIGQFWLFYALLRFLGAFTVGLVFWLFFDLIPDRRLAAIVFALFAGAEYVLFTLLPGNYLLDTINLFMCVSPSNLLRSYEVLTLFGLTLGRIEVYLLFVAILAIVGSAVILLLSLFRKPTSGMTKARRATVNGRSQALLARYGAGIAFTALMSILIWIAQLVGTNLPPSRTEYPRVSLDDVYLYHMHAQSDEEDWSPEADPT